MQSTTAHWLVRAAYNHGELWPVSTIRLLEETGNFASQHETDDWTTTRQYKINRGIIG